MTKAEELYHEIAEQMPDATKGKMFGALCLKAPNGKAAVMFWKDYMVFKLEGDALKEALSLDGAKLFDPMDGRPMNGWVQLSYEHKDKWKKLTQTSLEQVKKIEVTQKPKRKK